VRFSKPTIVLLALLLALAVALSACGKKGKLLPRDKLEDENEGVPVELRIYPPRQDPAAAIGLDDALRAMPGPIIERDLTPTPEPAEATPEPEPEENDDEE